VTQKELLMAAKAKAEAELRVIDANALLERYHNTVIRYSDYCLLGEKRCLELLPGASIRVSNRFEEPTVIAERRPAK
jgi:hypothetical protein